MSAKSPLARGLDRLARLSVAHPWVVVLGASLTMVVALVLTTTRLGLKTSNLDLVDSQQPEVRRFRQFAQDFGTPNGLIVVLEGEESARLETAAETLTPRLAASLGVRSVLGKLPAPAAAFPLAAPSPFFLSRDGKMLFLFVQPEDAESQASTIEPMVGGVRRAIREAGIEGPGVHVGLTGLPQYALDDRQSVAHDISRLSGLSFLLVLALFMFAFASFVRPVVVMVTLAGATAVLMGVAALWPGHLTLLSSFFGSIVFGMGVDFGILVVDRLEEHLAEGDAKRVALVKAVEALSPGLATGALTTAMGFFALQLTGFRGFAELGWLAGLGIVLSLLAMVTLLPAALVLLPERIGRERRLQERRIGRALLALQHPFLALALGGAAVAAFFVGPPAFNSDYLSLEPAGSEAVRLEREMVARSEFSTQFAAFTVPSAEAAAKLAARLRQEPSVASVHSAADLALLGGFGGQALNSLTSRFVAADGRQAVYAYPRGDIWDPETRDRFVARMRALDPNVTGMPFLSRYMIDLSQRALTIAGGLALAILILCVAIDLKNLPLSLLALMPTVLGLALMQALMHLLGIRFNPLNLMALPVVIGVGEDNAVHLLHRLLEEKGDLARALAGTGRSLVMTSGTTVASFVALSLARHQGLASFAQTLALGIASTLAMSLLVLPQAARWVLPRLAARGRIAAWLETGSQP